MDSISKPLSDTIFYYFYTKIRFHEKYHS
jgi:hypothetical protein